MMTSYITAPSRVLMRAFALALLTAGALHAQTPKRYKNFQASVYTREQEVAQMGDDNWLRPRWDNFADLYRLPAPVLNAIRRVVTKDLPVRVDGPANVALFVYDNDSFIVESFLDQPVEVQLVVKQPGDALHDIQSGERLTGQAIPQGTGFRADPDGGKRRYTLTLEPRSFRVLHTGG